MSTDSTSSCSDILEPRESELQKGTELLEKALWDAGKEDVEIVNTRQVIYQHIDYQITAKVEEILEDGYVISAESLGFHESELHECVNGALYDAGYGDKFHIR